MSSRELAWKLESDVRIKFGPMDRTALVNLECFTVWSLHALRLTGLGYKYQVAARQEERELGDRA